MLSSQLEEASMFDDETKSVNVIKGEVMGLRERNINIARKERGKLGEFGNKIKIASVLKAENEEPNTVQEYIEKISEQIKVYQTIGEELGAHQTDMLQSTERIEYGEGEEKDREK